MPLPSIAFGPCGVQPPYDVPRRLGAIPTDVTASGVDALVASGYKWLCGPFGVAVMYLTPHLQGRLDPGVVGFRSHEHMWDLHAITTCTLRIS